MRLAACALAAAVAVVAFATAGARAGGGPPAARARAEDDATRLRGRALSSIRTLRAEKGLSIDPALDPAGTGIIGDEFTPLTTSLGDVDAKRASANPAFAAALVRYFDRAGLASGDVVAVGASGSFPGLILATLSAARALGLEPIVVYSIGSSMYGANLPGFTFVDMLGRLRQDGMLPYTLAAVSPGGDGDSGRGVLFDEEGGALAAEARRSGLAVVEAASLADNIARRLRIYEAAAGGRPIRAFVNVGGASASFGDTPASLSFPNGLVLKAPAPPSSATRGLVFEFAARGVPVVHLLHVRGLARENGIPWGQVFE
jgi:poly-gamma-glutamate system protein